MRFICAAFLAALSLNAQPAPPIGSELRPLIDLYISDRGILQRQYAVTASPVRRERMRTFYGEWKSRLGQTAFDKLSMDGQVDYLLLASELRSAMQKLDVDAKKQAEIETLAPFAPKIIALEDARRHIDKFDPKASAATLTAVRKEVDAQAKKIQQAIGQKDKLPAKTLANDTAAAIEDLRKTLGTWFKFYNGYDPMFTWWNVEPHKTLDASLKAYAALLREKIAGVKPGDDTTIIGSPIGREALLVDLQREWIPYSPEELVQIADKEMEWCRREMVRAAKEMGFDNWRDALEKVKGMYVEPGKQPELIKQLAEEATEYVEKNDLVTVPALAKETYRMEMMSPARQLVNPFFLGGEIIQVSYPTEEMAHDAKLMTLRGNNIYFSRATVFHELIPGHHLQGFMHSRYREYRRPFGTPFATEGGALYWELLFWDLGFTKTPEQRVGALFWRMHRSARIKFSLSFQLGTMTPEQAVDMLVEQVGHERSTAEGEVRRSFGGNYSPLYQCAYLIGGLQIRQLHRDLVETGKMTNRQFHDAILQQNRIPVELMRAALTGQKLTADAKSTWRFYPLP
ncbi:MAG: DUF885 family protein [Bryobacteraceae bacterium]